MKDFWEANPLCSHIIPHALGSEDFFRAYDAEREAIESPARSAEIHEYRSFAGKRVLDVGSGNGYVLSRYALVGAEVFGVDLTDQAIALCRQAGDQPVPVAFCRKRDARLQTTTNPPLP